MNHPAIVIRDIHHYGDDLTVPEATARHRGGGQVTVTVTDPAPAEGDPRGNPRHGSGITVRAALGGQPELLPEISWEARSFDTDSAALFAEALALASQLAACACLASGQSAVARAAAAARARGLDAARRALATPGDCRDITARVDAAIPSPATCSPRPASPAPSTWPAASASTCPPARPAAVEDAFFTVAEALFAEAGRIARDRAAQHPGTQPPAAARHEPRPGESPDTPALIGKTRQKEQTPMTAYKLNHFTMADAQALAGKTADITEWDNDELETKVTYPGAKITGIIVLTGPHLVIETAGAVITDARPGNAWAPGRPSPSCACSHLGLRGR